MSVKPEDVLILMACSATKKETTQWLPAHELYDGPLWQTLRTHRGTIPWGNVCVLSGKYGFIGAQTRLRPYEAKLSSQKADYLIRRGVTEPNNHFGAIKSGQAGGCNPIVEANGTIRSRVRPYTGVILAGSGDYARVFEAFLEGFQRHWLVTTPCVLMHIEGGIGEQRQQLGAHLDQINAVSRVAA